MYHRHNNGGSSYCFDAQPEQELSDCSTRTSSERFYGEDDRRIIERLHFLTQRVEELEQKLETSLSSKGEDLSFDFSIDETSPVPKIDVKVLTGPKTPMYPEEIVDRRLCSPNESPKRSSSRIQGWEEATVERNSSFILIPSLANDKVAHLRSLQKKKQTLTLEYKSSASNDNNNSSRSPYSTRNSEREALSSASDVRYPSPSPRHALGSNATSGSVRPLDRKYMANEPDSEDSEVPTTGTCDTESLLSDDSLSSHSSKADQAGFQEGSFHKRGQLRTSGSGRDTNKQANRVSSTSIDSPNQNSRLRYGYTVSVSGLSPGYDGTKSLERNRESIAARGPSDMLDGPGKGSVDEVFHSPSRQSRNVLTSSTWRPSDGQSSSVVRMNNSPRAINVQGPLESRESLKSKECFPEKEFISEVLGDRPINAEFDQHKHIQFDHNGVDFSSPNSNSIDSHYTAQLTNTKGENSVTKPTRDTNKPGPTKGMRGGHRGDMLTGFVMVQKGDEITVKQRDRIKGRVNDQSTRDKGVMQMLERSQRAQDDYSTDEGSHRAPQPGNNRHVNTEDYIGLQVNNKAGKTTGAQETQSNAARRHNGTLTTPVARRTRPRSHEVISPTSSEDDDYHRVPSAEHGSGTRRSQRRRTQSHNPVPASETDLDQSNASSLQEQLRGLIDPSDIGNVQEELAVRPRVLLAEMTSSISPTESGYVEGSSMESTYGSVFGSERGTPVNRKPHPSQDSPYSSLTSISSVNDKSYQYPSWEGVAPKLDHLNYSNSTQQKPPTNSTSSESSKVFYIGPTTVPLPRLRTTSENPRLEDFFSSASRERLGSPASSVTASDFGDPFLECHCEYQCECQTGIATKEDFRDELKMISRYVLKERARTASPRNGNKLTRKYYLDEEQGEMDIFGTKLQRGEHKVVPMLVKVILRLRKHFSGGIDGPGTLKSLAPRDINNNTATSTTKESKRKISFSPSAMLLSAVGESSASEIRDVIEKDRLDVNQLSPSGKSLLHKAAAVGDLESIHTLIEYGANVNQTDQDGFSPINSALRRSHYKCAIFLVECGADIAAYTKARMRELAEIKNLDEMYMAIELNTSL